MNRMEKLGLFWFIVSINFYINTESNIGSIIFLSATLVGFTVFFWSGDKDE